MKINRNNYEVFLIDYLDGTLDTVMEAELLLFLETNPDIRKELEGLENASLEAPAIPFTEKNLLKKPEIKTIAGIGENNFEDYFVAFYENDLTTKQQNDLQAFLAANPQLKPEFTLHEKLLFEPDENTVFNYKEELKKKATISVWWLAGTGVAAAIALLFALFNLFQSDEANRQHNPLSIVQLAPKPVTGISTVAPPSIFSTRKKQSVQMEIETVETLAYETGSISKLNHKEILVNLNEETDYTVLVLHYRSGEILAYSPDKTIQEEKKRGVLGRVLNHNLKLLAERIPKRNKNNSSDPTFVKILDGSITAFNTVTGSEVEMTKVYTKDGHLTAYQIESETLNINRSIPESGNGQ